ncbi:insulin-like growth factor binding proteinn-terminal [Anaeramoeba flamelloides]|uniref:Insulin-like growth factor binding proteinn-terminal n=1 Tax=Anaeramoeba flamelloides TaxID=1746091 RepID=A0AAV7YD19_9EUKA|nr:insulin-like growth factor binding proteinn-terminal [Anaeramoeba flamelloides]
MYISGDTNPDEHNLLVIKNCKFENNNASYGGAIYNQDCDLNLINVIIENNFAVKKGGGFYCHKSVESRPELIFDQVRISNNESPEFKNIVNMEDQASIDYSCNVNSEELKNCHECYNGGQCNPATGSCDCQAGSHLPSPECAYCSEGSYSTTVNASNCIKCEIGKYNPTKGSETENDCLPCSEGTYNNLNGQSECFNCSTGTYNPTNGSSTINDCKPCSEGTYNNLEGQSKCFKCSTGQYQDETGQSECQNCPEGTRNNLEGQVNCFPCSKGAYQNETGQILCKNCPRGAYNPNSGSKTESDCLPCSEGTYQEFKGQGECNNCLKGTYNPNTGSTTENDCLPCSEGTYNNLDGQSECFNCSTGTYNPTNGSKTEDDCKPCSEGTYNNLEGQSKCFKCSTGQYQDETGQSECQNCPEGTHNNLEGQVNCFPCSKGWYQNETGHGECKKCLEGEYGTSRGQIQCFLCEEGRYQNKRGQTFCAKCPKGSYNNETGQKQCISCTKGQYQDLVGETNCKSCPKGMFSDKLESTICSECKTGEYQDSPQKENCKKCPQGTYNPNKKSTSIQDCLDCEIGRYNENKGQSKCNLCEMGEYNDQSGQTGCLECLGGSYSDNRGSTICKLCISGTYQNERGQTVCRNCEFNTYQSNIGTTGCNYCPYEAQTLSKKTKTIMECFCSIGTYGQPGGPCKKCPPNGICNKFNQPYPLPKPGYWNSETNPTEILKCHIEDACPGIQPDLCNEEIGYFGFLCEECTDGFYRFEKECLPCPKNNLYKIVLFVFVCLIFIFILIFLAKKGENYFGSISILVSFFQIIILFPKMLFNWPAGIIYLFKSLTFFNFNIDFLALECSINLTYIQKWFAIQLLPQFIWLLFSLLYLLLFIHSNFIKCMGPKLLNKFPSFCLKPNNREQNRFLLPIYYSRYYFFKFWANGLDRNGLRDFKNNCINSYVAFLFLIYLVLSLKILEFFNCSEIDSASNGETKQYILNENPNHYCYDKWWYTYLPFVIAFGVLYILGIPLLLVWMLYYYSKKVNEKIFNKKLGLLTNRFKREYFYWEFVITMRKIIVVIFVLYLAKYPYYQLLIFNLLFLISILVQLNCQPFNTRPRNFLEFILLTITQLILICGMIFYSRDFDNLSADMQTHVSDLIIVLIVFSFGFWLIIVLFEIRFTLNKKKKRKKGKEKINNINLNIKNKLILINKKFDQKKLLLLINYVSSLNKKKLNKINKFYILLNQYLGSKKKKNNKFFTKNVKFSTNFNRIWNQLFINYLYHWFKRESNLLDKIKLSKLLNSFYLYVAENSNHQD